jgi:acyl-CoA reductase-like NAD-dependent aldehyde dehydrogenase
MVNLKYHKICLKIELNEDELKYETLINKISEMINIKTENIIITENEKEFQKDSDFSNDNTFELIVKEKEEKVTEKVDENKVEKVEEEESTNFKEIVDTLQKNFLKGVSKDLKTRFEQLEQLKKMLTENQEKWTDALKKDLKQTNFLNLSEVFMSSVNEIDFALNNLNNWVQPEVKKTPLSLKPSTAFLHKEPFGVVLIIAPWNYPISLVIKPLVGAISAGNCAIIKPSEVTSNIESVFNELVPKYLNQDIIRCVIGGVKETTDLLQQKFDYIFYTGSPMVGKIIMKAASNNLTPVTLELGGKSPCIVMDDCDLKVTCRRIVWGKFTNW